MSTTRTVAKAAGLLMLANLSSRILGFVRESLIADFFGKSGATDAYTTAFILPDLIYWLLVGGVLSAAFIPVFSEYIAKGKEEEGWHVVSSVVNIIFLTLGVLATLGILFAPQFIRLEAPGFPAQNIGLAVHLTRIILLQPLLLALSGLTMGILNSYKIFWPSAVGTVLYNACVIVFGSLLAKSDNPSSISGFAFGVVAGAAANFAVQIPALRKVGIRYRPIIDWKHPGVRRIAALAVPIIISYSVNQIPVMINTNVGSTLGSGSITALRYSYRLLQLPVGIFALAIAVAIFPTMTEQAALQQWENLRQTTSSSIRMVIFATVPISVGMIVLRYPLIRFLFQHGEFTAKDTITTAVPLLYYALGITAQSFNLILPRAFYALKDTWTPVILGIISMGMEVVGILLFVRFLGVGGLALATTLNYATNMLLLVYFLKKKLQRIDGKRLLGTFVKSSLASILMGAFVWAWANWLGHLGHSTLVALVILVSGIGFGALIFAGAAYLMKMEELNLVVGIIRGRLSGRKVKRADARS